MSDFPPEILKITRYKVFQPQYSAHWIQRLASVERVEVATDSAAANSNVFWLKFSSYNHKILDIAASK